jgi:hypothetical protein
MSGTSLNSNGEQFVVDRTTYPLKKRGRQGIVAAGIVMIIVVLLIFFSKLNEIRQYRVPFIWKRRAINVLEDSHNKIKAAESTSDLKLANHFAIQADSLLQSAKTIIGEEALQRITKTNIVGLELKIKQVSDSITTKLNAQKISSSSSIDRSVYATPFNPVLPTIPSNVFALPPSMPSSVIPPKTKKDNNQINRSKKRDHRQHHTKMTQKQ